MNLKRLKLYNYKNYDSAELNLHAKVNLMVGDNGAGKTNLLDAIYYLSFCKSNFQSIDRNCIRHDQEGFRLEGAYEIGEEQINFVSKISTSQKKEISKDKKVYKSLSEHIGTIPLVIICPDDISAIIEGSEARRRLIDICLCQVDKIYLRNLISFQRVLKQRNAYLKNTDYFAIDHKVLDTFDEQMVPFSEYLYEKRSKYVNELKPILVHIYKELSGSKEVIDIVYKSELKDTSILELLKANRDNDLRLRRTSRGIHRDDFVLTLDDFSAKKYGSQGQVKSTIIALKLAQCIYLGEKKKQRPLLLLDDIFDKLDSKRVKNLLSITLDDRFGQLFISDTEKERIAVLLDELKLDYTCYIVQSGKISIVEK